MIATVAMKKGGVGKTTTAVTLATFLARSGIDVGLVDLDSQGSATQALGCQLSDTAAEVLLGERSLDDAWIPTVHGPRLISSGPGTEGAEKNLAADPIGGLRALAEAFHKATSLPQVIIIDTRPDENHGVLNALVASDVVWAIVQPVPASVESLPRLMSTVGRIRDALNPKLTISKVIPTMFDGRTATHAGYLEGLRRTYGDLVTIPVPMSIRVAEAHGARVPLPLYAPLSPAAVAYGMIADQIRASLGLTLKVAA